MRKPKARCFVYLSWNLPWVRSLEFAQSLSECHLPCQTNIRCKCDDSRSRLTMTSREPKSRFLNVIYLS